MSSSPRTFAIGDIHGDLAQLDRLLELLPELNAQDTLVFLGDYLDRGPNAAGVIQRVMTLQRESTAKVICLRGNHEEGWLKTISGEWPQFVLPPHNGCRETMESYIGRKLQSTGTLPVKEDFDLLLTGGFFPKEVIDWMVALPYWYEDDHAIYVHAGLPEDDEGGFTHPSALPEKRRDQLLWLRSRAFFEDYRGKLVVFGHTITDLLPPALSSFTPDLTDDLWVGPAALGVDTACGKGGFLTAVELPLMRVYESRY